MTDKEAQGDVAEAIEQVAGLLNARHWHPSIGTYEWDAIETLLTAAVEGEKLREDCRDALARMTKTERENLKLRERVRVLENAIITRDATLSNERLENETLRAQLAGVDGLVKELEEITQKATDQCHELATENYNLVWKFHENKKDENVIGELHIENNKLRAQLAGVDEVVEALKMCIRGMLHLRADEEWVEIIQARKAIAAWEARGEK